MKILGRETSRNNAIIYIIVVSLAVFGSYGFVVNGISKILFAGLEPELVQIASSNYPIPVNDSRDLYIANSPTVYHVNAFFNTTDVFSANRYFDYKIQAFVYDMSKIDKIIAINLDAGSNMTDLRNQTYLQHMVDNMNKTKFYVTTLLPDYSTHSFIGSKKDYSYSSEGETFFLLIPYKDGKMLNSIIPILTNHPLKIYPVTAYLQVETDRDLRKQIIESTTTNDILTGLTWIIIGLVPIGFLVEFVIEYVIENYFYRKENSKNSTTFSELDENPNYYHDG